MSRQWTVFLAAVGATAALALGFGVGISRAVAGAQAPPRLQTVPMSILAQAGITVAAASQPPYCDLQRGAADRQWLSAGSVGCAISRPAAEAELLPAFQGHVSEAVLARVTGPSTSDLGRDELVWMLVVQSSLLVLPTNACGPPVASGPACAAGRMGPVSTRAIVFIDANSGQVLTTVPVPGRAPASPSPATH